MKNKIAKISYKPTACLEIDNFPLSEYKKFKLNGVGAVSWWRTKVIEFGNFKIAFSWRMKEQK